MAWGELSFIRDLAPPSLKKLNDMFRYLFGKVQGGIERKELGNQLSLELDAFGDLNGPSVAVTDNIVVFADETGKLAKDGGLKISGLAKLNDSPTFTGNVITKGDLKIERTGNARGEIRMYNNADIRVYIAHDETGNQLIIRVYDNTAGNESHFKSLVLREDGTLTWDGDDVIFGDSGWQTPNMSGLWEMYSSSYHPVEYRKIGNRVHLRGLIKNGSGIIFSLPSEYRPDKNAIFAAPTNAQVQNRIIVYATGGVVHSGTLEAWLSLEGISFMVD